VKGSSEDLSIHERRGELDEGGAKQLALLLSGSLEARLAHRAGREFDAGDSVLPGDEALAQRITQRLLLARPVAPRLPRRWLKPAFSAGAIAVLALAIPFWLRERAQPISRSKALAPTTSAAQASRTGSQSPTSTVEIPIAPASAPGSPPSAAKPSPARAALRSSATEPGLRPRAPDTSDSAGALFARANRARRAAEPERAVALYQRLRERFPSSPEAQAAAIALGMLKLQLDDPEAALRHFGAYLAHAPQGELGSEALWGQARAYLALGRADLARKTLRLLLSQYPESAYAGAARAKLQALP
jgi:TolA-binding protein